MKYTLIEEKGQYALLLRGESMTQYAVVSGLDWTKKPEAGTGHAAITPLASPLN